MSNQNPLDPLAGHFDPVLDAHREAARRLPEVGNVELTGTSRILGGEVRRRGRRSRTPS